MADLELTSHISHAFNEELEQLRARVLGMGGLVEEQLAGAVRALLNYDVDAALRVVERDDEVNALEIAIDEECALILAKRQPAASDLRLVVTVIKTITDLERIGDEAQRVAKMAHNMAGRRFHDPLMNEMELLGRLVGDMLRAALNAFARMELELAVDVVGRDDHVDAKYESLTRQLVEHMTTNPETVELGLNLLWASRSLERIGDRSQNLAEYIVYLVRGTDVRHSDPEIIAAQQP